MTFDDSGEVIQEDSYYPFGIACPDFSSGTMTGLSLTPVDNNNLYLYNGKELQEDFELDWYDYGARFVSLQRSTYSKH